MNLVPLCSSCSLGTPPEVLSKPVKVGYPGDKDGVIVDEGIVYSMTGGCPLSEPETPIIKGDE